MALTALKRRTKQTKSMYAFDIASGTTLYIGSYAVCNTAGYATTPADTAGFVPLGFVTSFDPIDEADGKKTGDTTASPVPKAIIDMAGTIVKEIAVTAASAQSAVGERIYLKDDDTFTLSESSNLPAVGEVVKRNSATSFDVLFYSQEATSSAAGGGSASKRNIMLGAINTSALEGASAKDLFAITMRGHGKITRVWARPSGFDSAYTVGSQKLNLEIGTVNLSGGVITLLFSNIDAIADMATSVGGTTVGGKNEFNDGDKLTCELATGGAGFKAVSDTQAFEIWADITYFPGNQL